MICAIEAWFGSPEVISIVVEKPFGTEDWAISCLAFATSNVGAPLFLS